MTPRGFVVLVESVMAKLRQQSQVVGWGHMFLCAISGNQQTGESLRADFAVGCMAANVTIQVVRYKSDYPKTEAELMFMLLTGLYTVSNAFKLGAFQFADDTMRELYPNDYREMADSIGVQSLLELTEEAQKMNDKIQRDVET